VADSIGPTPDDSESSVVADDRGSGLSEPGAAVTDDQSKVQREVGATPATPRATSEPPAGTKPGQEPPQVEPRARSVLPPRMVTVLADVPLADRTADRLGFLAYVDALCGLIDNPRTPTPLTIAVSAPWGAGKTSVVNMVTSRLAERTRRRRGRPHIVCMFPAWLHDDAPHLGAALAAKVARQANRYRAWPRRLFSPLPSAMLTPEQRWRRRIIIGVISLIVAGLLLIPESVRKSIKSTAGVDAAIRDIVGQRWAPLAVLLLAALAIWPKVFASAQAAARFVDDPKSEAATGSMWQVREQLGRLIREAIRNPGRVGEWLRRTRPRIAKFVPRYRDERRRLILIIDDLERCRPPRAIDVCEVASQLLGHRDVVTIIIGDMATFGRIRRDQVCGA
jgi:KAP family P-loop domain